jgi:hypothetical protein
MVAAGWFFVREWWVPDGTRRRIRESEGNLLGIGWSVARTCITRHRKPAKTQVVAAGVSNEPRGGTVTRNGRHTITHVAAAAAAMFGSLI